MPNMETLRFLALALAVMLAACSAQQTVGLKNPTVC